MFGFKQELNEGLAKSEKKINPTKCLSISYSFFYNNQFLYFVYI